MTCVHRGIANSLHAKGFIVWGCNHRGFCTEENQGLTILSSGQPMPACSECALYQLYGQESATPLVSAVCLAYDLPRRQSWLEEAVESFLRQTWPHKELVIVVDNPNLHIECDSPGVRVVNVSPCRTLGDKYNAGVEAARGGLICSWDDDDISLSWRMGLSVELIGDKDYYNPKAHWTLYGGDLSHQVASMYGHNASMFRKSAWEAVGKYKSLEDNSQDAVMDRELIERGSYVIGSGRIELTSYLYRFSTGVHHGCYGKNPDENLAGGTFKLNPHWQQNYTKALVALRPPGVPAWITNRDTMHVRKMVNQLLICEGLGQITIVDCDSTYQPLLDWYETECPVNVIRTDNKGPMAPWSFLDSSTEYIVTDGDLDLSRAPRDFPAKLSAALQRFPSAIKAGLSLAIDDLPDESAFKARAIAHEAKFWQKPLDAEHFDAAIDTTLAMYRPGSGWGGYEPAVRLNKPYTARHVSWYLTPDAIPEDWKHYAANLRPKGLTWSPLLKEQVPQQIIARRQTGPRITIGMACFRDWPGVWATIQHIRMCHQETLGQVEFVVVDNDPMGTPEAASEDSHSFKCRQLCQRVGGKYDHFVKVQGTAAAKGRIFELAAAPIVLVLDCHVLLPSLAVSRLIQWFEDRPNAKDLVQGPCVGDGGADDIMGTHFAEKWGGLMYGQWATDPRVYTHPEFEIPMQGCGLFACRKDAWPGFHPLLRGFGPEEFHIHQRIRKNGGRCLCLPWLKWCHRFGNPGATPVPGLRPTERLRGHLITNLDSGLPELSAIRNHFVDEAKAVSGEDFDRVLNSTVREFFADRPDAGEGCEHRREFLRTTVCEIGCIGARAKLPVFSCAKHGQCAPSRWEQIPTMKDCVGCVAEAMGS